MDPFVIFTHSGSSWLWARAETADSSPAARRLALVKRCGLPRGAGFRGANQLATDRIAARVGSSDSLNTVPTKIAVRAVDQCENSTTEAPVFFRLSNDEPYRSWERYVDPLSLRQTGYEASIKFPRHT